MWRSNSWFYSEDKGMTPGLDREELYSRVRQSDLIDNGQPIVDTFYAEVKELGDKPENVFIGGFS